MAVHFNINPTITDIQNVCVRDIARSIVIHSIPTDETVIAMYYYSLSETAALIIKQKTITDMIIKRGDGVGGLYCCFQCLNYFVSQPLSGILLLS